MVETTSAAEGGLLPVEARILAPRPDRDGVLRVVDHSELDPRFASFFLSGQRIEVEYRWGETERFYVGRSGGWRPCWLTIKTSRSLGGAALLCDVVVRIKPLPRWLRR